MGGGVLLRFRLVKVWSLLLAVALVSPAYGEDDPAALQARGEKLAKDGQFADAIEAFKAADAIRPDADHACLIGLAYSRRNLYGQAELFFDLCHERVEQRGSALPSWLDKVEREVRSRIEKLAAIKIIVKHGAGATIGVSAFLPDETFTPRTIHLPPGNHTITVTPADGAPVERRIVVEGAEPQEVVFDIAPAKRDTDVDIVRSPGHLGRNVAIAGLGILAVGAIVHATWYRSELGELEAAQSPPDVDRYDAHVDSYTTSRYVTVGLYAAGAATAIIGLVLHATRSTPESSTAAVSVTPTQGGGIFAVEWSR
ncbi:hypothetical protein BH11MYX3_BH11MYX3_27480 [soil metagenome]